MNDDPMTESVEPRDAGETTSDRPRRLDAGEVVGDRYEILRALGTGGFSVVYHARDRLLGRDIALKILRSDRLDESTLIRFRREARVARDAVAPQLVRVHDIGRDGDRTFLTLELVEGETLKDRLDRGPLDVEEAVRLVREILRGLAVLHSRGIVHRDIKPSNILLAAGGAVKLADFGLARRIADDETRATRASALVGTLEYLSPEQALGDEVGPASDLYSVGVVLFEVLTGELPLVARSSLGKILGHVHQKPASLRARRPEIPRWLAATVSRLLEKHPEDRFPSADALLAALEERKRPGLGRRRWTFLGIGLALLLTLFLFEPSVWFFGGDDSWPVAQFLPGSGRLVVKDRQDRILWQRDFPYRLAERAQLRDSEPPRLVTFFGDPLDPVPETWRTLQILDLQTGDQLGRQPLPAVPYFLASLRFPDRFSPRHLTVVDLNDDGVDEVVVDFFHYSQWPSYSVLWEPTQGRTRLVLTASGQHIFAGAADVDGDGAKELIYFGANNRMGFFRGLAAVRLSPRLDEPHVSGHDLESARTPGELYELVGSNLLAWYTLLPMHAATRESGVRIVPEQRTIELINPIGETVTVGFDGFLKSRGDASELSGSARSGRRRLAYHALSEARRLQSGALFEAALAHAVEAREAARQAGDVPLVTWCDRVRAELLASVAPGDAEELFQDLYRHSESPADIAWEAATAFHLEGYLEHALSWYRRGFFRGGSPHMGRSKVEHLLGRILALDELGRFEEIEEVIDRSEALYGLENPAIPPFRTYLAWRRGQTPEPPVKSAHPGYYDTFRYWSLELRRRRGEPADELLEDVRRWHGWVSEESRGLVGSLLGELLVETGEVEEGLAVLRESLEMVRWDLRAFPAARGHYEWVTRRFARVARTAGLEDEARRAETIYGAWKREQGKRIDWRPPPPSGATKTEHPVPEPPRLEIDGERTLRAFAPDGKLLWRRPEVIKAFPARLAADGPPRIVGWFGDSYDSRALRRMLVLDARSGEEIETVGLPYKSLGALQGLGFNDRFTFMPTVRDLDGDGVDEVLVSYAHRSQWPSYHVLYEPRFRRVRTVLFASGHQRFADAVDLDGDGSLELLFLGVNNRLGWLHGLAAISLAPPLGEPSAEPPAADWKVLPGELARLRNTELVPWYALLPSTTCLEPRCLRVDAEGHRLEIETRSGGVERVSVEGFREDGSVASSSDVGRRREARQDAFWQVIEARRLADTGYGAEALAAAAAARRSAAAAGDELLAHWIERVRAEALMAAGRWDEGSELFHALAAAGTESSSIAFQAATTAHLAGRLDLAIDWYRRSLGTGASLGRMQWEHLVGLVLALGELGRWQRAEQEISRYRDFLPMPEIFEVMLRYARWRRGARAELPNRPERLEDHEFVRYWRLELRRAAGDDPAALLADAERELTWTSEEHRAPVRSLRAELLAATGRLDEALREARLALEQNRSDLLRFSAARSYFPLVTRRFAAVARSADRETEAAEADRALEAWRDERAIPRRP